MRHTYNQNLGRFGPSGRLLELFEIMVTDSRSGRRATCSSGSGSRKRAGEFMVNVEGLEHGGWQEERCASCGGGGGWIS